MEHRLVYDIEKALGWSGPDWLGRAFSRGSLPDVGLCARLLTPTRLLDLVMRRSLTEARIRCLQNGADVHPQAYITTQAIRRAGAIPMVEMERLGQLLREGCTLVLDGVNVYDPTLEVACRALQWWSHELVQVNIYLTTGDAAGFQLHWDDHDVLIVQLAGEKSWEVRGLSRPVPMYRDVVPNPAPPENVMWRGAMRAGEVMHIPRGYWHQATRQDRGDGFSLHATFGFPKRTGVDYLVWLADYSREHQLFRHDIDRWGTAVNRSAQQLAFTDEAVRMVTTQSVATYLAAREQQLSAVRHMVTHNLFGKPSSVVCVTEFPPAIEAHEELVTVRAARREITLNVKALPAVQLLLSGRPVSIDHVTAATGVDAAELAAIFVAEDICTEATPELLYGYADLVTLKGLSAPSQQRP